MVIAALLSFGILFIAWMLAPGGPADVRATRVELDEPETEALPVAA
jgi:hypothetical protein